MTEEASNFKTSPEELVVLKESVNDWLKRSMKAVWSFRKQRNGACGFWRDTNQFMEEESGSAPSIVSAARCYKALAYAETQLTSRESSGIPWKEDFRRFQRETAVKYRNGAFYEQPSSKGDGRLNHFEMAHLADFEFTWRAIQKSDGREAGYRILGREPKSLVPKIRSSVQTLLRASRSGNRQAQTLLDGQVFFDPNTPDSRHFFVTLHALRAVAVLQSAGGSQERDNRLSDITGVVRPAKDFCIRHCYHSMRGSHHALDATRLAFAGVIYCLYDRDPDKDVCSAVVEALERAQLSSGNWPATHPIERKGEQTWYIATHEIALCLTWLYFQPKLPDQARAILLDMMRRYFQRWVIPTYLEKAIDTSLLCGWYDDRATGRDMVVGWATAIVCHFLANYRRVLSDHINRRVIESLGLEEHAERYLIDETSYRRSRKWQRSGEENHRSPSAISAIWPDLPPYLWRDTPREIDRLDRLGDLIAWYWTDPRERNSLSTDLAQKVLAPVYESPRATPGKVRAGILDGPPGTRKTSLVKCLALLLDWPYVPVPASAIFENGFDRMEATASVVFRRLGYLSQCVIFFDEFEEFLRCRPKPQPKSADQDPAKDDPNGKPPSATRPDQSGLTPFHDRTIAAFTTSAMLPRLQDLHDQQNCIILLATNDFHALDEAIVRPGRFDFRETITHPTLRRFRGRRGYLNKPTKMQIESLRLSIAPKELTVAAKDRPRYRALREAVLAALEAVPKSELDKIAQDIK